MGASLGGVSRLEEPAENLYYSWDRHVRALFVYLDPELWEICGHNPKFFLRRVAQHKLEEAAHLDGFSTKIFVSSVIRIARSIQLQKPVELLSGVR
ncbi:glycogen phosphorylase [Halorhodospira halochloris]|uniref:Glycogen phosphorylase n=1 Tax=Halorhodospira halochloris TaxID=1052 RepID=A0A0X8X9Q8_HALHR|nr:DUF3417 domain-containing protein [Halorhodospira halochloris]BAU57647.1 glycogen phosphorylase [Halorhodospira halochloris]